jgi:NTP pyrophosphatase (non-canonical NTP hydrolase)
MFHLNKIIMKAFFKKILLLPLLMTGVFALFLSSCDKDKDEENEGKSLDVTVNFTGDLIPEVGDVLNVVVFYTKISELDFNSEDAGPDFYLDVVLTQSDIDNGVTVKLDMIDLNKPEIYVGALVDMDDEAGPSPGDLIEFFDDVDIIDAMLGVAQPTNCHGKKSVEINLDKVMTLPSLDVTVNFTGDKTPEAGDELAVVVFYTKISELDFDSEDAGPDFFVEVPLTQSNIDNGITVKLYMNMIDLDEPEIYVAALVDMDNEAGPSPGDLIEFFDDVDIFEAVSGTKDATNVAGKTAITINLDKVFELP